VPGGSNEREDPEAAGAPSKLLGRLDSSGKERLAASLTVASARVNRRVICQAVDY
jgi:hypothetical protein